MTEALTYGILFGFVTGGFTLFLNFAMGYGHILNGLRHGAAFRSAKRQYKSNEFKKRVHAIKSDTGTFEAKANKMNDLYWTLADNDKWFFPFMCIYCLGGRVNLIAYALFSLYAAFSGVGWLFILLMFFASVTANFLTIDKLGE